MRARPEGAISRSRGTQPRRKICSEVQLPGQMRQHANEQRPLMPANRIIVLERSDDPCRRMVRKIFSGVHGSFTAGSEKRPAPGQVPTTLSSRRLRLALDRSSHRQPETAKQPPLNDCMSSPRERNITRIVSVRFSSRRFLAPTNQSPRKRWLSSQKSDSSRKTQAARHPIAVDHAFPEEMSNQRASPTGEHAPPGFRTQA